MKILFLTRLFYPHIGGVEKHVLKISERLVELGHDVIIVTEELEDKNTSNYHSTGESATLTGNMSKIKIHRISVGREDWFKKFRIWQSLWKIRHELLSSDIVHCHDVFFWYLPFRFLYPRKKVYTTFHGYETYPISKGAKLVRKISEVLSQGNICIGDFMRKWYGTRPTFISYGAVDISTYRSDEKYIKNSAIFYGRLDSQTSITTYIDAYKLIRQRISDFKLLVIGNGELENTIPSTVEHKPFSKGINEVLPHYQYAFVSRYLSILEAMAAKRLVFAVYDNPVKEDYLKLAPFRDMIIVSNTPKQFSDQVFYYKDHQKEAQKKIDEAYLWVKSQTWNQMSNLYLKLWRL